MLVDCHKPDFNYHSTKMPEPKMHLQKDAVFYPKDDIFQSRPWGVYDLWGRIIPPAALYTAKTNLALGQEFVVKNQRTSQWLLEIETAVYGGFIGLHYGHTLLEFLPRLWYLKKTNGPSTKIIVHCGFSLDLAWKHSWFHDLMSLIGITKADLISPRETVLVRNLFIPESSFQINAFCTKTFANFTHWIGDQVPLTHESDSCPYFLTKMKLSSGVVNYINESDLCARLEKNNFKIIATEELSFFEQIKLFKSASGTCGVLGSNIHTSIFSRSSYGIILNIGVAISDSFYLLDKATNANFRYVSSGSIQEVSRQPGFARSFRFEDPVKLADSICNAFDDIKSHNKKIQKTSSSNLPSLQVVEKDFFKVSNGNGKYLCFKIADGALASTYNLENYKSLAYPAVATLNDTTGDLEIFALSPNPRLVCMNSNFPRRKFIYCGITKINNNDAAAFALYNKDSDQWLTLVPNQENKDANFSAQELQGWEYIYFERLSDKEKKQAISRYTELALTDDKEQ